MPAGNLATPFPSNVTVYDLGEGAYDSPKLQELSEICPLFLLPKSCKFHLLPEP